MELINAIDERCCEAGFTADSKADALTKLAEILRRGDAEIDAAAIAAALKEREELGSTAFESGIAIPHARVPGVSRFIVAVVISPRGVDFDSFDKKKTHFFAVILGPEEQSKEHLQLLAALAKLLKNTTLRKELLRTDSPTAIRETVLAAAGNGHAPSPRKEDTRQLVTLHIFQEELYYDLVNVLLENGVSGASVSDTQSARDILSREPLFAGFLNFLGRDNDFRKAVRFVMPKSGVPALITSIEEITGDLDTHSGAAVWVQDLALVKGAVE